MNQQCETSLIAIMIIVVMYNCCPSHSAHSAVCMYWTIVKIVWLRVQYYDEYQALARFPIARGRAECNLPCH